jgi:hypothetical protein
MNTVKGNSFGSKYVNVPENNISSRSEIIIIIIIKLNSILYYLCAESTAARPITDTAQCRYR